MALAIQSEPMNPIEREVVPKWKCRHCKHKWPITDLRAITNPELQPKQCPNRKCRAADWNRPKIKPGRPKIKPQQSRKRRRA